LDSEPTIFYVNKDDFNGSNYEVFDKVILDLIDELLKSKYKDIKFYCHNLGGFDVIFLIGTFIRYNEANEANETNEKDSYKMDYIFRDKSILKITISKKINGVNRKVQICDSYAILTSSQKALCLAFGVDSLKTDFPYKFLHQDNLSYIGNTPDKDYFENLSISQYKALFKND
jgi:hypothetical protein